MIYLYIFVYILLLCIIRYSGVCSQAYMPLFTLFEDSTLYPGDMYVHGSIVTATSYLYPLLKIFGAMASNTYFLFFVYLIISVVHVYYIYKIAELFFPQLKDQNVGLILLLMFMYDYPIITSWSQLICQHSFCQAVVAMPMIAAGLYYFFKGRFLLSLFIISILVVPLHFKSGWFFMCILLGYGVIHLRKFKLKEVLWGAGFTVVSAGIIYLYKTKSIGYALDFDKKLALSKQIMGRNLEEDFILMTPIGKLAVFCLFIALGIYCIRFIKDALVRSRVYFFFYATIVISAVFTLYTSVLYQYFPAPEVILLSLPRSMAYPIIISFLTIGGALLFFATQQTKRPAWIKYFAMAGLFALAWFPNMKVTVVLFALIAFVGYFVFYKNDSLSKKMGLKPLTVWLYMSVVVFLLIRATTAVVGSYQQKSPFFPLSVFGLERDYYDVQIWARENTQKEDMFLSLVARRDLIIMDYGFRRFSARPMIIGDYSNFYLNYDLLQEHSKREEYINSMIKALKEGNLVLVKNILSNSPWRLNYVVLPATFNLDLPLVYENKSYKCFAVINREIKV